MLYRSAGNRIPVAGLFHITFFDMNIAHESKSNKTPLYLIGELIGVPNFGTPGRGVRLLPGMTIAIEPMINQGSAAIRTQPDGWTVRTKDGKLSAHFEHTVAITADGPKIMTQL